MARPLCIQLSLVRTEVSSHSPRLCDHLSMTTNAVGASVDPYDRAIAAKHTPLLRISDEPRWDRVRAQLHQEGIRPTDAAIGALFPDDPRVEFCLVVARDDRCFSFEFVFRSDGDGDPVSPAEATVESWRELGPQAEGFLYERGFRGAREYLENERQV